MSKRGLAGGSGRNFSTKKSKVEELGDFWDDELDGDIIDDCFMRATQDPFEDNAQVKDVTLLSSYSIFKEPKRMFTSTQASQFGNEGNLEEQLKEIQERYAEKEGEVSILRSNLQNLRTSCQADQEKKQSDWKDKLSNVEKENKAVRSELEFKNLEVANLKQQIVELSKIVNAECNVTQKSKILDSKTSILPSPKKFSQEAIHVNPVIYIGTEKSCPLRRFNYSRLIKELESNFVSRNCRSDRAFYLTSGEDLDIIYKELSCLIGLSEEDLNSDEIVSRVKRLVNSSSQLLKTFCNYLEQGKIKTYSEEKAAGGLRLSEASATCGDILLFIAEILPFSTYLKSYLLQEPHYLLLLSSVVHVIGKTRKETACSNFLSSVIRLLCRTLHVGNTCPLQNALVEISKGLLSLRPNFEIVSQIVYFLSIITRHENLVDLICPNTEGKQKSSEELCRFLEFINKLEHDLMKIPDDNVFINTGLYVLNLMYNIFRFNNPGLHQQETKGCECLSKLCKLTLDIIYKNLELYNQNGKMRNLLRKYMKLLCLLTFNAYELTQKYVSDFARSKEIIHTLIQLSDDEMEQQGLKNLRKLVSSEDFPQVPSEKFDDIDF